MGQRAAGIGEDNGAEDRGFERDTDGGKKKEKRTGTYIIHGKWVIFVPKRR